MRWFKKKKKKQLKYKFLCKTCDIFFLENNPNSNKCPICGRSAEVYNVEEVNDERK